MLTSLTIVCLWRRYYGSREQAAPGAIYRIILVIGTVFMYDIIVGLIKGHWIRVFDAIAINPDLEYLMVDGSIVRVHQQGAAKKHLDKGGNG